MISKDSIDHALLAIAPRGEMEERRARRGSGMQMGIVDPFSEASWDDVVLAHGEGTFFHSAAWARVLSKTYGHRPVYLRCMYGGKLAALIPMMEVRSAITGRRGVGLPFTDFCGPLMYGQGDADSVIEALSQAGAERKWKYFEVRDGKVLGGCATPAVSYYAHIVDLRDGAEACFSRCASAVRRAVRKAETSALAVEVSRSSEAMETFYELHGRTRKRHGAPPQPISFFRNIQEEVIRKELGFVVVASEGRRAVAAAVYFHFGNRAIYKFGASDERRQELRGNNLVMWTAIKHLAKDGFETLHMGRTSLRNEGLRRFKLSWGAAEEKVNYFQYSMAGGNWSRGADKTSGFHTAMFKRLPVAANRLAGAILYPHLD